MTVNDLGPFFANEWQGNQLSSGGSAGGKGKVRVMILLHELGHLLRATGFQSDFGDSDAVKANNKLVQDNCKATLHAAGNAP
jgi:hypothetical protein